MWRHDIYRALQLTERRYGNRYIIVQTEAEIDNGQYLTEQESMWFEGEFGNGNEGDNILQFSRGMERPNTEGRREGPGSVPDVVSAFRVNHDRERRGCRSDGNIANIHQRLASISTDGLFYRPPTDDPVIGRRIVERARAMCKKREIVRSVCFFNSLRHLSAICTKLGSSRRPYLGPGLRIIGIHYENEERTCGHIHILHDCNRNRGSCRCTFLSDVGHIFHAKGTKYVSDFSTEDLIRYLLYLCQEGRELAYVFLDDRRATLPSKNALLQIGGYTGDSGTRTMEEVLRGYDSPFWASERCSSATIQDVPDGDRRGSRRGWISVGSKRLTREEKMQKFILKYYHVPLEDILRSSCWLGSEFRYVRQGDKVFQIVCDTITSDWIHKSLEDIHYFWQGKEYLFWKDPKWITLNGPRYTICESVDIASRLLMYQFGSEDGVMAFLDDVVKLLDRKESKKNCLEICSPPSAGKNFFIDPLLLYLGSFGQIANANRNNMFAFDNCFNKRVLLMNEPNFEASFREQLLMLFAGDTFSAQAKYKSVSPLAKTPVIVLTNDSPFPNKACWNDRMYRYRWRRCDWLKECKFKLDPLFFIALCKKYNVDTF